MQIRKESIEFATESMRVLTETILKLAVKDAVKYQEKFYRDVFSLILGREFKDKEAKYFSFIIFEKEISNHRYLIYKYEIVGEIIENLSLGINLGFSLKFIPTKDLAEKIRTRTEKKLNPKK